jgi:hypothetical protein
MSWDVASQIATSLGALLAAASLVAGFILYRLNQRDTQADQFSQMIGVTRPNVEQLRRLVSYELGSELATTTVYSRDLDLPFKDLFAFCRPESGTEPTPDELGSYLDTYFPVITVPLSTPLVRQYETKTTTVASDVALYQASFPGVYRVVNSMAVLYRNVLGNSKELVRDEGLWKQFLPNLIEDKRVTNISHMKWVTGELLTGLVLRHLKRSGEQIALVIQMLDMTFETYLKMTPAELKRASRAERGEKVQPTSFTKTITEDLDEAEKCLRHVFTEEQGDRYRDLLTEFKNFLKQSDEDEAEPPATELLVSAASPLPSDVEADQLGHPGNG